MDEILIHDRGRGPEIVGTRITVLDLVPYFLDPTATEFYICQVNNLSAEQVAAARAYALNHADAVLAEHLEIEARIAAGNPPSLAEKAEKTHEAFVNFRQRLAERDHSRETADNTGSLSNGAANGLPAFRDWIAKRGAHAGDRS